LPRRPSPVRELPSLRVTEVRVRLPAALTSAIRKAGAAAERVMTSALPVRLMAVVMIGSPSGPFVPLPLLLVRV